MKHAFRSSVPGFDIYYNKSKRGEHRGGVMMLVKCSISKYITKVDMDTEDMVWLELSLCAGVKLGGVYIPPSDSQYFDMSQFSFLCAKCIESEKVVLMGDLNARVGNPYITGHDGSVKEYGDVKDDTVNAHGRLLIKLCNNCDMAVVNHLENLNTKFGGNLSFKKRNVWISEIDLCVAKNICVPYVKSLKVNQSISGSDHAPLCTVLDTSGLSQMTPEILLERSGRLGEQYSPAEYKKLTRTCKYESIDLEKFKELLENTMTPDLSLVTPEEIDTVLSAGFESINRVVRQCSKRSRDPTEINENFSRWQKLLESKDPKQIWSAVNWKGNLDKKSVEKSRPDDEQFRQHFENLLDPSHLRNVDESVDLECAPYIPVLDDPFTPEELTTVISTMKKNKSYIGICPGLISTFPYNWCIYLLNVLNFVFIGMCYPFSWCFNKMFVLYKHGDRLNCNNYRGISVMDTVAKIYDLLLMNRLSLWMNIDKCQSGGLRGRGCIEQIMSLRLLCDYAVYKKTKLYVLFIDFSKAYDKVPRNKLTKALNKLGCGKVMLKAIRAMYECTKNVLCSAIVTASVGVRQGAPSSCLLFLIYIDQMVKMLNDEVGTDGFLGTLHALLLMDDTVLVATSREKCLKKMDVVMRYCEEYGMVINEKKTKFLWLVGMRQTPSRY